jgi:hypothetical protein
MSYKVLISDDDKNYVDSQLDLASNLGIELVHHDNWQSAKAELENNWKDYQGIILDGKGRLKAGAKGEDINHLKKALRDIAQLQVTKGYIQVLINTGFVEDSQSILYDEVYFEKGDEERMYAELVRLIELTDTGKLKKEFNNIFELYDNNVLSPASKTHFIDVLYFTELYVGTISYDNFLTPIRKIIESLLISFTEYGLLPKDFTNNQIHLNPSLNYLSGKETRVLKYDKKTRKGKELFFEIKKKPIPSHLVNSLFNVLRITQQGSHLTGGKISKYKYKSIVYQLFDFLQWYGEFIKKNLDPVFNADRFISKIKEEPIVIEDEKIDGIINIKNSKGVVKSIYNVSMHIIEEKDLQNYDSVLISRYYKDLRNKDFFNVIDIEKKS